MAEHKIETIDELHENIGGKVKNIGAYKSEQNELYKALKKARRKGDAEAEEKIRQRLSEISAELKILRREVRLCREIEERSAQVEENFKLLTEKQEIDRKEREDNEFLRRSSGSGRENKPERG